MEISYTVYNPTGNITLLVQTPLPRSRHAAVAKALMGLFPHVEQVGFFEIPGEATARLRLQMMGGEFCGNATMSAAAHLAQEEGLAPGATALYPLEVSGYDGILTCQLAHIGDHFLGTVSMPLPEAIGETALPFWEGESVRRVPAVRFPGIVHCIIPTSALSREEAERVLRPRLGTLCQSLQSDACGILLFDPAAMVLSPLVYVSSTATAVWESGCGSGTAAIGAYLTSQSGAAQDFALRQSGGVIRVRSETDGRRLTALSITGEVRRVSAGTVVL